MGFIYTGPSEDWVSLFGGMEWWNGTVEWNSGMVEYWNGGMTTPTSGTTITYFKPLLLSVTGQRITRNDSAKEKNMG